MIVFTPVATTNFTIISATRNTDKTITVNWGTQNETAVTNYTVEHSNDGINFTAIATESPSANNGTNPSYSKVDANATLNRNWYRIKATNISGSIKYSPIAMVNEIIETPVTQEPKMSIYPNPVVDGKVNLHLDNQPQGNYVVTISNKIGQTIQNTTVKVSSGNVLQTINIGTAQTGTYQILVIDEVGKKTTIPFIVK